MTRLFRCARSNSNPLELSIRQLQLKLSTASGQRVGSALRSTSRCHVQRSIGGMRLDVKPTSIDLRVCRLGKIRPFPKTRGNEANAKAANGVRIGSKCTSRGAARGVMRKGLRSKTIPAIPLPETQWLRHPGTAWQAAFECLQPATPSDHDTSNTAVVV